MKEGCDMENNKKIPGVVKLSEQNGKLTLEINGTAVPNLCGYRMWVDPKDPLVVKLSVDMEFFRSDMQGEINLVPCC